MGRRTRDWRQASRRLPGVAALETGRWLRRRRQLIEGALTDEAMLLALAAGDDLPQGYGRHVDERAVELPWVLSQRPHGRVLDAGSALNHDWFLDALLPRVAELHVVTLVPEEESFTERGVAYAYSDLRDLPYRDGLFDTIVSVSTLEHVGMDNTGYGAHTAAEADPDLALAAAFGELRRVLAPGGRILVTVPYGADERHGWLRQFGEQALGRLVEFAAPSSHSVRLYRHDADRGWQPSDAAGAAGAHYGRHKADAVACVALEY